MPNIQEANHGLFLAEGVRVIGHTYDSLSI